MDSNMIAKKNTCTFSSDNNYDALSHIFDKRSSNSNRKLQPPHRHGNGTKCSTNNSNTQHTQQVWVNNNRKLFVLIYVVTKQQHTKFTFIWKQLHLPAVIKFSKHCQFTLSCTTSKFLYRPNVSTFKCTCTHTLIQLIFSRHPQDPALGCAERITMHSTRMLKVPTLITWLVSKWCWQTWPASQEEQFLLTTR